MREISGGEKILLVTGLMITQTFGWGATFSQVGILASPIADDLGLSRGTIFLGATILYIFAALSAPAAGRLADRVGGLRLLIPGSAVLALGLWSLSRADGVVSYLLPWALWGAVFHVGLVTAAYTGLAQVMGRDSGRAVSTLTLATGLCSTIFWPVSEAMLSATDWRGVLATYGLGTILVSLPIHVGLYLRFGKLRAGDTAEGPKPALPNIQSGAEAQGQRLMIAVACVGSLVGVGFGVAAIEIYMALGASRVAAVHAGALIGIAYVVSRALSASLADRVTPARLAQVTYLCLPLSFCPLLYYGLSGTPLPGAVAVATAFAFGLPAGLVGILRSLFPLYLFGSNGYGARLGVQARATELTSAAAPFGFTWALGLSAGGLVAGLILLGGVAFWGTLRLGQLVDATSQAEKA